MQTILKNVIIILTHPTVGTINDIQNNDCAKMAVNSTTILGNASIDDSLATMLCDKELRLQKWKKWNKMLNNTKLRGRDSMSELMIIYVCLSK